MSIFIATLVGLIFGFVFGWVFKRRFGRNLEVELKDKIKLLETRLFHKRTAREKSNNV